jgi:hypothetical protein
MEVKKMRNATLRYNVNQPEVDDYNGLFPKMPCNTPNKQAIFSLITDPDNIHRAIVFVQESGGSPVSVFESKIQNAINSGSVTTLSWHEKQFVGTATCAVMENNGFSRTGRKQRFSKGMFKSGEIYA